VFNVPAHAAATQVCQKLGPRLNSGILPILSLMFTRGKKCKIWSRFSTPVAALWHVVIQKQCNVCADVQGIALKM